jgi:HSP20 family protein
MSERAYGAFQGSFAPPDGVDRDKIAANLEKVVLTITLPKTPETQKSRRAEEDRGQERGLTA